MRYDKYKKMGISMGNLSNNSKSGCLVAFKFSESED